jgi:hypothetical protein
VRHASERRQIVLDGEIDGDTLRATERATGEEPRLIEAAAAPEALESTDARLRSHRALVYPDGPPFAGPARELRRLIDGCPRLVD